MPSHEEHDERKVRLLRRLLNVEEPVPLGLRSRVEARIAAEHERGAPPRITLPVVLGLAGFIGGSAMHGLQLHSGGLIAVLALGSALYGAGMRRLVGGMPTTLRGRGDRDLALPER